MPRQIKARPASNSSRITLDGKLDRVVRYVVHAIAIGKWLAEQRLPSVRDAERLWSVNRLTIFKAYRKLVEMGLVRSTPRSGFYVAQSPRVERVSRHRVELDRIYQLVSEQIRRETGLSPLGAWRYLAQLAESRAREQPECAFVECTRYEAQLYAAEILARFGMPCLALSTDHIGGQRRRIPPHVHTLLTTAFHRAEVQALAAPPALVAVEVPIQFSPRLAEDLAACGRRIVVLGINRAMLTQVAVDMSAAAGALRAPTTIAEVPVAQLADALREHLPASAAPDQQPMVVLSSTLWEVAPPEWQSHPCVRPLRYEIAMRAAPALADALGLPLGEVR